MDAICFYKSETTLPKHIFIKKIFGSSLNSRMFRNMGFGVQNCLMPKRASVQLLHGQMIIIPLTGAGFNLAGIPIKVLLPL